MSKLFTRKSKATFLEERPNITFSVAKDCIHIIFKHKPGFYLNLSMSRTANDKAVIFADWGKYFTRLSNPQAQIVKIEKCCPTLYGILAYEDSDGIVISKIGPSAEELSEGFCMHVDIDPELGLLFCFNKELEIAISKMVRKTLKVYAELYNNPPFPAWKSGLIDLWE